jgi:hypothetical protein
MSKKQQPNKTMTKQVEQSVILTETEDNDDPDVFYNNIIDQFKTVIISQHEQIDKKNKRCEVLDRAMRMQHEKTLKVLRERDDDIKDKNLKIRILEQELNHHREVEIGKIGIRANTRKTVTEMHEINTRRRDKVVSEADLDAEALEYLKQFEIS